MENGGNNGQETNVSRSPTGVIAELISLVVTLSQTLSVSFGSRVVISMHLFLCFHFQQLAPVSLEGCLGFTAPLDPQSTAPPGSGYCSSRTKPP